MIPYRLALLLVILVTKKVEIQSETAVSVLCPGTRTNLNCSVQSSRSAIQWRIWCNCEGGSIGPCEDTCSSPQHDRAVTVNAESSTTLGMPLCNGGATYDHNFTTVSNEENDTLVQSSVLSIALPLEFQQQNSRRLCLKCLSEPPNFVQIGCPLPPTNFDYYLNYNTSTATDIEVNFSWSSNLDLREMNVVYMINITEASGAISTKNSTIATSFTTRLQINSTYLIQLQTCSDTLSDSSSFLSEVENRIAETAATGKAEAEVTDEVTAVSLSDVYVIVFAVLGIVSCAVFNFMSFGLGVVVGTSKTKKKAVNPAVSATQSDAVSPATSEPTTGTEQERVHEYEDIVLHQTPDINTFTSNVAYGLSQ